MKDVNVFKRIRRLARRMSQAFKVPYTAIRAEPQGSKYFGTCYEGGVIHIRIRNLSNGNLLQWSTIVDTLCHELAHAACFKQKDYAHSEEFARLHRAMLVWYSRQPTYIRNGY
jgi:hypothetical protein